MYSMILTSTVFILFVIVALVVTRGYWSHLFSSASIPGADYLYSRLPSTFTGDIEAGLSSSTFDLSGNVQDSDSRAGLDDASKAEILKIMKRKRMTFDQARKQYMESRFAANGIGADGRPRDPKFVSFS